MVRGVLYYSTMPQGAGGDLSRAGLALALACIDALGAGTSAARADAMIFPPRGKPRMPGAPQFSVSHSAPIVACAAVSQGDVGLDVECDPAADRLTLAMICDDTELALARRIGVRGLWIAKEAALKAGGGTIEQIAGVRVYPGGASFRGAHYHEHRIELDGQCPACIMTSEPDVQFEVRRQA